jgi:Ca2+-binding RTX toxin-like protein
MSGNGGNDILDGGAGDDTYVLRTGSGPAIIIRMIVMMPELMPFSIRMCLRLLWPFPTLNAMSVYALYQVAGDTLKAA